MNPPLLRSSSLRQRRRVAFTQASRSSSVQSSTSNGCEPWQSNIENLSCLEPCRRDDGALPENLFHLVKLFRTEKAMLDQGVRLQLLELHRLCCHACFTPASFSRSSARS